MIGPSAKKTIARADQCIMYRLGRKKTVTCVYLDQLIFTFAYIGQDQKLALAYSA